MKILEVTPLTMGGDPPAAGEKLCRPHVFTIGSRQEEQIVSARLERIACSYSAEMTRRLERHRLQLESRLERHRAFVAQEAVQGGSVSQQGSDSWVARVRQHLATERGKLEKQVAAARERLSDAEVECDTLAQLRANLVGNNSHWRGELACVQKRLMAAELFQRTELPPLENRVRELMAKLDHD
jgi:hypothetical protein